MKYPFLFEVFDENGNPSVKIAWLDMTEHSTLQLLAWDHCCWVPDVCIEKHEFKSELEALKFIQNWWSKQTL